MNWGRITEIQERVGSIGAVILLIILAFIVEFLFIALCTWGICSLMNWPWGWNIAGAAWIALLMITNVFSGIRVNTN